MRYRVITGVAVLGLGLLAFQENLAASEGGRNATQSNSSKSLYEKECGSCHLAYPARLLPKQSWQRIMGGLSDHFGDNAELAQSESAQLTTYLIDNGRTHRSASKYTQVNAPLRITELRYFRHEHNEIPARIRKDPKVGSLSQCDTCHQDAKAGRFSENKIHIPGHGRWDD